ncbi:MULTISPECIES: 3-isopropylmalate dehydratase small subunit [unclassified Novosphingobium]|uniref:3-isopropylmalate dehydratase small subunit n=1 Tax=unclassified Novosphingobium TaxID=2644732 RepID=UPI0013571886|nr:MULTISPECIES: 3-isopropylmalate dehydratase small subunit [unclassified Novosphingobium]
MTMAVVAGRAYPLGLSNVDTDQIIGSDWLKTISKVGLGEGAFAALRDNGVTVFDDERYKGSEILVAGANFGCGSSREHAAWAIVDTGIRVVIAPSFSDIFSSNAFKNGILTAVVDEAAISPLMAVASADGEDGLLKVDLIDQIIETPDGQRRPFNIDPFRRECLIEGLDEIALTRTEDPAISAHEARVSLVEPWLAGAV